MNTSYFSVKNISLFFLFLFVFPQNNFCQQEKDWEIKTSLKCDAFSFLNAVSHEKMYNYLYPRELELWKSRLGNEFIDSVNAVLDSTGSIGFKASYIFTYLEIETLQDIINLLSDSSGFTNIVNNNLIKYNDFRLVSSLKDLKTILDQRSKLIYLFGKMKESGWEEDWQAVSKRLEADISLKKSMFSQYSPEFLCKMVDDFLKQKTEQNDSSSRVYYLYYAYPNGFKMPYNMMATWSIEYPMYFFSVYMHERLHSFSIYSDGLDTYHNEFIKNSKSFSKHREIMTTQLYESDDEFYILAAEAYLSVKAGLRNRQEAINYLKSADGGTAIYSLMIFEYLEKYFDSSNQSYGAFLKNIFFEKIKANDIENYISKNSK